MNFKHFKLEENYIFTNRYTQILLIHKKQKKTKLKVNENNLIKNTYFIQYFT